MSKKKKKVTTLKREKKKNKTEGFHLLSLLLSIRLMPMLLALTNNRRQSLLNVFLKCLVLKKIIFFANFYSLYDSLFRKFFSKKKKERTAEKVIK